MYIKRKIQNYILNFGVGFILSLFLVLLTNYSSAQASGVLKWQSIDTLKTYNLRDIATNEKGLYVAVGDEGLIKTSQDLVKWTVQASGTKEYLFGCTWGNGKFIVVGKNGTILYSKDGTNWNRAKIDNQIDLQSVTWGNGKFIAVGCTYPLLGMNDVRYILSSTDGIKWTIIKKVTGKFAWSKVDYLKNQFIAYNSYDDIATSSDGINWTIKNITKEIRINHIIWDGNQYVGVGSESTIWTSRNALDWTKLDNNLKEGLFLDNIIRFNNMYFATISQDGTNIVISAKNLSEWKLASQDGYNEISKFIVNEKQLIGVGWYESLLQTKDGTVWEYSRKYSPQLVKVIWNGTVFLTIGNNGTVYLSKDGLNWTAYDKTPMNHTLIDVVWTGKEFVAMDQTQDDSPGSYDSLKVDFYKSVDGISWTFLGTLDKRNIDKLFYLNSRYFVLGRKGEILSSVDAINWESLNSGTINWLRGLSWSGKKYVCVGMFGTVLTSPDGITWTKQKSSRGDDFNSVLWNGKMFVTVGGWKTVGRSLDGQSWVFNAANGDYTIEDTIWDGERFILVQNMGEVISTKDTSQLTVASVDSISSPLSIAWNGERYVMVGANGSMATCLPNDLVKVKVNDDPILFDVAPKIIKGRTMIPARAVLEKLGATVNWDSKTETIQVNKPGVNISLTIGKPVAFVNGNEVKLDSPAIIIDGRTLVPVRFLAESLGSKVSWIEDTKTVLIN